MPAQFSGFDSSNLYSNPEGVLIGMKGVDKRLKIFFEQGNAAYDPYSVSVVIENSDETVIVSSTYDAEGSLIKKESTGVYYINAVNTDPTYTLYDLTLTPLTEYILKWTYLDLENGETQLAMSYLYVLNGQIYSWFPRLRNLVDKAFKMVGCARIGYTDGNLFYYLQGGLDEINKFPPMTSFSLISYPSRYGQLLMDSASVVALTSQALFSVDTDVPSFNDQGFSLSTDHFSRLNTMMTSLATRIEGELKRFKMEFCGIGSVQVQMVPYFPLAVMMKTAPRGSLFRNLFVAQ